MNIMFLCTGNSCRSQMGEGFGKFYHKDYEFYSAGILKSQVNPYAIIAMEEVGVDISSHSSNSYDELSHISMDLVITVCDHAQKTCPFLPNQNIVHVPFDDPPALTDLETNEEKKMAVYRRVRDEIQIFVKEKLVSYLNK